VSAGTSMFTILLIWFFLLGCVRQLLEECKFLELVRFTRRRNIGATFIESSRCIMVKAQKGTGYTVVSFNCMLVKADSFQGEFLEDFNANIYSTVFELIQSSP